MIRIQVSLTLLPVHKSFFAFGTFVGQLLTMDTFDVFFKIFIRIGVELVTMQTL